MNAGYMLLLLLLFACGGAPPPPPVANHTPPAVVDDQACRDHRTEGRTFALTASAEPNDTNPVDESFDETWEANRPRFANECRPAFGLKRRVAVNFHVTREGVVTDAETFGQDAELDQCVCKVLKSIVFPRQRVKVFASLELRLGAW
jgi:hypothetical protein